MPTLHYNDSDGIDRIVPIGLDAVLIGRATECHIQSTDARVSRKHARIFRDGDFYWIEDLGSSNGVFLGTERVTRARLPPGEVAVIGSLMVRLVPDDAVATPTAGEPQLMAWLAAERKNRVALEEERDALGRRLRELVTAGDELKDRVEHLTAEVKQARGEAVKDKRKAQAAEEQLEKLRAAGAGGAEVDRLRAELEAARKAAAEHEAMRAAAASVSAKLPTLESDKRKLEDENSRMRGDLETAKGRYAALEDERKKVADELAMLKASAGKNA